MATNLNISLTAEPIFHLGPLPVTNSLLVTWLVIAVLLVVGFLAGRKPRRIPRGLQNAFEYVFELLLGLMDSVTLDRKKSERFFPFLATFFVFIAAANLTDILPGVGTVGLNEVTENGVQLIPFFRPPASDLNFTVALAVVSVITTQILGIAALGLFKHLKKYFTAKGGPVYTFVGLLELVSEVAKVVSFSFRLFGNIFAGEVLLTVIAALVPFVVPLPFYLLELFVALVQALVFTMLSLVFFTVATASHEEHESEPQKKELKPAASRSPATLTS
ncbi:MAG: F0F1 ATP synthase subunit A [Candidatus Andersenbacteria bacterium]